MAPDRVAEDVGRLLGGVDGAADDVHGLGADLVAALDQPDQLVDDRRRVAHVGVVAVEGEHVAAQEDIAAEPLLELAQDRVLGARELGGRGVVEGELPAGQRYAARRSLTRALTRLPSARPPTLAIAGPIDLAHLLRPRCPGLGDRLVDDRAQLVVGELGGQVALDQRRPRPPRPRRDRAFPPSR